MSTRPSFASPDPLAAASGLTIPLKITLSDIRLSAFIILVFSKQKGVTLVFRNDPLESLKVSSTFDSIPFVRDYLQKEISGQLRTLLINEVPAIIHRLSLRLFVSEYRAREEDALTRSAEKPRAATTDEPVTDPLASPPQDPVDARGNVLDPAQVAHLTLDAAPESAQSLFSRRNLLRLAALRESNHTLSLFTPRLADVVYRAAPAPVDRQENQSVRPSLRSVTSTGRAPRSHAATPSVSAFSASDSGATQAARPPLNSMDSSFTSTSRLGKPGRKRKHRVVNLRKKKGECGGEDTASVSGESMTATSSSATTSEGFSGSAQGHRERELITPPSSPSMTAHVRRSPSKADALPPSLDNTPRPSARASGVLPQDSKHTPRIPTSTLEPSPLFHPQPEPSPEKSSFAASEHGSQATSRRPPTLSCTASNTTGAALMGNGLSGSASAAASPFLSAPFPYPDSSPGGVLEKAWMMRMAGEIARRVQEQKDAGTGNQGFWDSVREGDEAPPPAYGA